MVGDLRTRLCRALLLLLAVLAPSAVSVSGCSADDGRAPPLKNPTFGTGGDEGSGFPDADVSENGGRRASGGRGSGGRARGGSASGGESSGGTASGGRAAGGRTSSGGAGGLGSGGLGTGGKGVTCIPGKTLDGNANLHSMADLEALRGYTAIKGFLYVGSNIAIPQPDVVSLEALSCLETVTDDVEILEDPFLQTLHGLEKLRTVGADFKVSSMASLETLDALGGITVGDTFLVRSCPELTSLGRGVTSAHTLDILSNDLLPLCELVAFEGSVMGVTMCYCDTNGPGTCPGSGGAPADAGP